MRRCEQKQGKIEIEINSSLLLFIFVTNNTKELLI